MNFFESDLAFRQHADEPIYDCRENCEMAIYRSTDIDEVNAWLLYCAVFRFQNDLRS